MIRKFSTLSLTLLAAVLAQPASAADGTTLPIKKISADASQQLVVEFGGGSFPTVPQVLDLPGPNHRVVIDFADASLDKGSVSQPEEVTTQVKQSLPFVKGVRFSNLENSPKPTARVVVDLPEEVRVKPRVVKLEEGLVVIGFSDQPLAAAPAAQAEAGTAAVTTASGQAQGWDWSGNSETAELKPAISSAAAAPESPVAATSVAQAPAAPASTEEIQKPAGNEAASLATQSALSTAAGAPAEGQPAAAAAPAGENRADAVKKYNRAVQLHLSGKLDEAITAYKEALEVNSSLAEAHSNLGLIYNQQHNYAQALSEFRKALAINPKDAITYNGIGAALRAEKDLLGAIKNWQTATSLDPKLATAHYNLGTAYEIQKEYDKALLSYRAAVKNDYRLGEAYYRMGLIMERKHRSEEALEHFRESLKVAGESEYSEDARQRIAYLQQNLKKSTKM